jgi:hypothetical protein
MFIDILKANLIFQQGNQAEETKEEISWDFGV